MPARRSEICDVLAVRRPAMVCMISAFGPPLLSPLSLRRIALVGGVIAELLHGVDRVLGAQHRKAGGWIAASDRSVAGGAGRNAAGAIAAAIQLLPACQYDGSASSPVVVCCEKYAPEILHVLVT